MQTTGSDVSALSRHDTVAFVPQAGNYGESSFLPLGPAVCHSANATQTTATEPRGLLSTSSLDLPQTALSQSDMPPTSIELDQIYLSELYKPKRQRMSHKDPDPEWLVAQKKPFLVFAKELLEEETKLRRIGAAKEAAASEGFPLLRMLRWNTTNRIRAIAYDLCAGTFQLRASWTKSILISKFLEHIRELGPCISYEYCSIHCRFRIRSHGRRDFERERAAFTLL
jgi:hypothetical protein